MQHIIYSFVTVAITNLSTQRGKRVTFKCFCHLTYVLQFKELVINVKHLSNLLSPISVLFKLLVHYDRSSIVGLRLDTIQQCRKSNVLLVMLPFTHLCKIFHSFLKYSTKKKIILMLKSQCNTFDLIFLSQSQQCACQVPNDHD